MRFQGGHGRIKLGVGFGWGLCGLLCVALQGLAIADTPTPPTKPAQASTTPAAKPKHPASSHAVSKRTSSQTWSQKSKNSRGKKGSKYGSRKRGQQAIDATRARQIQIALIREHYMQGQPSGSWDSATQAAMKRYQADQGWQSKQIPDSRALIKLGLGPSHDHLLNPESAMTSAPGDPKARQSRPRQKTTIPTSWHSRVQFSLELIPRNAGAVAREMGMLQQRCWSRGHRDRSCPAALSFNS